MSEEVEAQDKPKKRDFLRRKHEEASSGMSITSLMDAISIILCYLLISANMDPWNVKQDQYLKLAQATADTEPLDSMSILVNRKEILVDAVHAIPIECQTSERNGGHECRSDDDFAHPDNIYTIDKSYKEDGSAESFKVTALLSVIEEKLKGSREIAEMRGQDEEFRALATVISDQNIPYRIIAEVINTMGQAGIEDMRFAVMQGDRWVP